MDPLSRLIDLSPVFVIFPTIYFIVKIVLEYNIRKRLIEKDMIGKDTRFILNTGSGGTVSSSLKWGLVFILVGLAAIIIRIIPDIPDEVAFGVLLIAAGAGLLVYYFIGSGKIRTATNESAPDQS
nr:hypothetical protein [candidate division Zixibacteria bacterium]